LWTFFDDDFAALTDANLTSVFLRADAAISESAARCHENQAWKSGNKKRTFGTVRLEDNHF
jgi:hypothetical protein